MNNLLKFILRFHALFIFLALEGVALLLLVNNSYYQRSQFYGVVQLAQNTVFDYAGGMAAYFSLREENDRLAQENALLKNRIDQLAFASGKPMDMVSKPTQLGSVYTYIPAKVISNTTNRARNLITLDVGEWDGVKPDMGVITDEGVVGIVLNTSGQYATVISMLNRGDFQVSVRIKKTGDIGSLDWDGADYRKAVIAGIQQHVQVAVGDTVETSHLSSIFPEGLPLGVVTSIETQKGIFQIIHIRLNVDFGKLYHVQVVKFLHADELHGLQQ